MPEDVLSEALDKLDPDVRAQLRSIPKGLAELIAGNLVMAGRLFDDDPELAYRHARTAARIGSRIAATREAAGLSAYATGRYAEALTDLRTVRRMTGAAEHWAIMADCERGLGRPERALAMAGADEVRQLDAATRIELRIVAAGARRDLDQLDAAIVTLQVPELNSTANQDAVARLRYAYADALLAAGRTEDATEWFARAADADPSGETGAADRLVDLEGLVFTDLLDEDDDADAEEADDDEG